MAQVGKFTLQHLDAFKPSEHISRGSVHNDTDCNSLHTKVFILPCTKSSPSGEEVHWARQDGPTDLLEAFNRHIQINDPLVTAPFLLTRWRKVIAQ